MAAPPPTAAGAGRIAGAAALIAALTVLARLAGFGRTAVFMWTVTDNALGDIYLAANTVPNIIFELVAGGALASLVVPLLAGAVAAGDRAAVAATTSALLTWTLSLLVPLAVLVAVFAGPIVGFLADERTPATSIAVGERMLQVFAPQLPLYGVGVVLTGVLQAHHRFAWPVIAPLLSSVTVIGAYLGFAVVQGRGTDVGDVSRTGELILSVGTTVGVVVLSLCLLVPLRRLGLRLRPAYRFPGGTGRQVVRLGWAGVVTVGAQQLALLLMLRLALAGPPGTNTRFFFAQTIYLLPWAVLAVPLATAAYPALAAARATGADDRYRETLARATRGVLLLSCLGAAALVALAEPVARFFAAGPAAAGIVGFAPGLLGYGLFAVLSRALYARGDSAAAAGATAAGWAVAAVGALVLAGLLADRVLALTLGTSAGMLVLGALLAAVVVRRAGRAALAGLGRTAAAGVAAAGVAALAGRAASAGLDRLLGATPAPALTVVQGMLCGVVVLAVFAALAYPLDPHDARPMAGALVRRLARRRTSDREDTTR